MNERAFRNWGVSQLVCDVISESNAATHVQLITELNGRVRSWVAPLTSPRLHDNNVDRGSPQCRKS